MEKITVKKFVEEYDNRATDNLKEKYIKDNLEITANYIPYVRKITLAKKIVDLSSLNEKGSFELNSPIRILFMFRTFISNYTNLVFETDDCFEEYDLLKQSGLFEKIMELLPADDLNDFNEVINLTLSDSLQHNTSIQTFCETQLNKILSVVTDLSDQVSLAITTLDDEKIGKISQIANGFFTKFKEKVSK